MSKISPVWLHFPILLHETEIPETQNPQGIRVQSLKPFQKPGTEQEKSISNSHCFFWSPDNTIKRKFLRSISLENFLGSLGMNPGRGGMIVLKHRECSAGRKEKKPIETWEINKMGWKFHVVPTPKLSQPVSIPKQNIFTFFPALLTIIVPPLRRAELSLTFG